MSLCAQQLAAAAAAAAARGETIHNIHGSVRITVLRVMVFGSLYVVVVSLHFFKHSRDTIHQHKICSLIIDDLQYLKKISYSQRNIM